MHEFRFSELRAEGRTLSGEAVVYGDVAALPWGEERIEPGAFPGAADADVVLNRQHDRGMALARTGGGGMTLTDAPDALRMTATLPQVRDADDVLALVRARVLRGLSLEFLVEGERTEGQVRVIERAKLVGLAVVDRPAYPAALVQARTAAAEPPRRRRVWL